jgi:nickel superoxide dismutase
MGCFCGFPLHQVGMVLFSVTMKTTLLLFSALLLAIPTNVSAHCQVPCGIYDDDNVIGSMHTDFLTIEKACTEIDALSKDPSANAQQIVRWTVNKEKHAQDLQEKVLNYFLAQRLKMPESEADNDAYMAKLKLCHEVIVTAMKCKQSTDVANVDKLKGLLDRFAKEFGTKN